MVFECVLYGSDTDVKDSNNKIVKYPLKTIVTTKPDLVTLNFTSTAGFADLEGLFADLDSENKTVTYWSGGELVTNNAKDIWKIKTKPFAFPTTVTSTDLIFGKSFLNKKYKWLDIKFYPIRPDVIKSTNLKLIAINVTGRSKSTEDGLITLTFDCKERP